MAKTAPAADQAAATTEARVLTDGVFGKVDEVVTLDAETLAQAVSAGAVDPHPDAVAYAKSLTN